MSPLARWKDLCIDVVDVERMAPFWAGALGLRDAGGTGGVRRLDGPTDAHRVWLNVVPEPKTVKHRLHLDLRAGSVADLEALGATRLTGPGDFRWTVLADPEGGELCVFEVDDPPPLRLKALGLDAHDTEAVATWWAGVFGAEVVAEEDYHYVTGIPMAPFDDLDVAPVPEPKAVKNRIHWDVTVVGESGVDDLLDAGASLVRARDDEIRWHVLADPEGNEFCAFVVEG